MHQDVNAFLLTGHAEGRVRQRGLRRQAVELALALGDVVVPVGRGREAWSVSRRRVRALRQAGLPATIVERLGRVILIVEPLTRTVVTAINGHQDAQRRLRRDWGGRRHYGWEHT